MHVRTPKDQHDRSRPAPFAQQAWRLAGRLSPLLDLIFPRPCPSCGAGVSQEEAANAGLCQGCAEEISPITPPMCQCCGEPLHAGTDKGHLCEGCIKDPPAFTSLRSLFWYKGALKELICGLKFRAGFYCLPAMAALMEMRPQMEEMVCRIRKGELVVIPIPLSKKRLQGRGFNHAHLIARQVFPRQAIKWHLMTKERETESQAALGLKERRKNLKGAFRAHGSVKGMDILLFDDVYTTGSTMKEAASTLKSKGAGEIFCLTVARTPLKERPDAAPFGSANRHDFSGKIAS